MPVQTAAMDFESILIHLQSPEADKAYLGLIELGKLPQDDARIRERVLPLLWNIVNHNSDASVVVRAAGAIDAVAGADVARPAWTSLLNHPNPNMAATAALGVTDLQLVPLMLEILQTRDDAFIRGAIARQLGRLRPPAAFEPLVQLLNEPTLRIDAIDALGDLGDPRAIPFLQPHCRDLTSAGSIDNHGPTQTVGDLATSAIRKLHQHGRQVGGATSTGRVTGQPPPLPVTAQRHTTRGSWLLPLAPLMAFFVSLPWMIVVVFVIVGPRHARQPLNRFETQLFDVAAVLPVLLGLGFGVIAMRSFRSLHRFERIGLIVGMLLCALVAMPFVKEFFGFTF